MKLTIDTEQKTLVCESNASREELPLYSDRAFDLIAEQWVKVGWNQRYSYTFSWMGRPIIQLPEDMVRIQEVIWRLAPDVVIETGVAHGGSLVFYAGLLAALGKGRVIGVDVEIRPHNRAAIEAHPMSGRIQLIEGSSTAPATVAAVRQAIGPGESVLVILDSNHSRDHVAAELDAYAEMVTPGSYIVACDGIMAQVTGAPRSNPDWDWNNPISAIEDFLGRNVGFRPEEPGFAFNEGVVRERVTYWPKCFLRRIAGGTA